MKNHVQFLANEIRIMKKIDHPNIIKFHEAYQDDYNIYLVQEYCDGGDISARQKSEENGVFSEKTAGSYILQLLQAVNYMHCSSIVHRDLKLDNLMLTSASDQHPDGVVKVIDFGLSHLSSQEPEPESEKVKAQLMKTKMMSVVGTPLFMAPEVFRGSYDFKCDYWSIGVILYFMLSGTYPYTSLPNMDYSKVIASRKLSFDSDKWTGVSKEAKDLIRSLMSIKPGKRPDYEKCLQHPWMKPFF